MVRPPAIDVTADSGSLTSFALRWKRLRSIWDLIFVAMLFFIAWPVSTRLPVEEPIHRLWAILGIALAAASYATLGYLSRRYGSVALATVSIAIGWGLLWTLTRIGLASGVWPLFVPLLIQMWASLPLTTSIALTVLGAFGSGFSWWGLRTFGYEMGEFGMRIPPARALSAVVESIAYACSLTLFSLSIGLLITRMLREARQLATTVDELHRTQAMLVASEREQGSLAERQRVAREIHDTVAQGLISLVSLSRAAQSAIDAHDGERAHKHLRMIESTAVENLSEARVMVANLSPEHLQERSLVQAITRVIDRSNEKGSIQYTLEVEGDARPLGPEKDLTALRIVQEALANVHRHSLAENATVQLNYLPRALTISVSDDGVGFDATAPRTGFGLDGVSARVREVGGLFTLTSYPGVGTALNVRIPT